MVVPHFDYAIVGGGLQAGLIALAVRAQQPSARVAIVERAQALGGNHTWCFHADDVPATLVDVIAPLVVARWDGYDVAFPAHQRTLSSAYAAITSERLDQVVRGAADALWFAEPATAIEAHRVATASRELTATVVIDARGPDGRADLGGWQVFLGQEVRVPGHGLARPMLMDATVPQRGGFRFLYVLPLDSERLLLEDTLFADTPTLDVADARAAIAAYAATRGWTLGEVLREETGVLPLPLVTNLVPPVTSPIVAGYAGGWFHPVTGYSFPIAARLAAAIAAVPADQLFGGGLARLAAEHQRQLPFANRLNRMLYTWYPPEQRFHVLERFYRLPEATIRRFYSLAMTVGDRARILIGRPPRGLSLKAALTGRAAWRTA